MNRYMVGKGRVLACVAAVSFPFPNAREREENCERALSPPPYFSPIFWLTHGVLRRSPAFRSLVRSPPEKGKESAATQARRVLVRIG